MLSKDRFLKLSKEDCIAHWTNHNHFAKTLLLGECACKMLELAGIENKLITKFTEYVLKYKNDVNMFAVWI